MVTRWAVAITLVAAAIGAAACGGAPAASPVSSSGPAVTGSAPAASPESPSPAAVTTFDEFATEACSAFTSMQRAIGNPDTGEGSEATEELEAAIESGNRDAAARAGAEIDAELEVGRRHARAAAGWEPASRMMTAFDRFLAAYQAQVAADLARGQPDPADSQRVFEEAGGVAAWDEMIEAYQEDVQMARPSAAPRRECAGVPIDF